MLISKEKHYNLKDLFQVKLLSCAIALFWGACFILLSQLLNLFFNLSHLPDQDRTTKSAHMLYAETSQRQLGGMVLYGVTSSCSQAQPSILPFLAGHGSLLWGSVPTQDYQWQSDPE